MDDKILNTIGKLTIEINGIKDALPKLEELIKNTKPATDDNVLELMSKLEQRVNAAEKEISTVENRLLGLERVVGEIAKRSNEFNKSFEALKNDFMQVREIAEQEITRRAKISKARAAKRLHITDVIGFGGRLRALRRKKNMHVRELCEEIKVSESTVTNIENFHLTTVYPEAVNALSEYLEYDFFEYVDKGEN